MFRTDDGCPRAFRAHCPHRGCDFTLGQVVADELICAYHGWHFDASGRCTYIPASGPGTVIPAKFRATTYAATDSASWLWVYAHPQDERQTKETGYVPPQGGCLAPEALADGWVAIPFQTRWKANWIRVVESVLDVSHLPFVHPDTTGECVDARVAQLAIERQPDGIVIRPRAFAPAHPLEPKPYATSDAGETEIQLWFPNQWLIRTPMGDDNWICTFLTFTPLDDEHTDIFGLALRSFQPDNVFLDEFHIQHTLFVMEQDQRIVESIRPYVPPMNLQQELHVPSDTPTARHRAMIARTLHSQL